MAPPDPRPGRPAVAGPCTEPDEPDEPAGSLGPGGVWPPPRPVPPVPPVPRPAGLRAGEPATLPLPVAATTRPVPGDRGPGALLRRVLPTAWRGARVDPGRPGATALALVAAAAAVVAAVGVWSERPRAEPVGGLPAVEVLAEGAAPGASGTASPAAAVAGSGPTPEPPLVVSVSGTVHRPGLVEVPGGSRVADVLEAAGGALPGTDLTGLNLARRVADGEQVAVGVPAAPDAGPPGPPGAGGGPTGPAGKVDLNAATLDQLDALPGVGPVTARRILDWRTAHGRFARVEQLREIEGIGERRFGQLRELVEV